jgi:hypothetical protein
LEDFRKSPKSKNLQKHIQILVVNSKQKIEIGKRIKQKKGKKLTWPQPIEPAQHAAQVRIPIRYRLTGGTHGGEDRRLQPPIKRSSSLSSSPPSTAPGFVPPPSEAYKILCAATEEP